MSHKKLHAEFKMWIKVGGGRKRLQTLEDSNQSWLANWIAKPNTVIETFKEYLFPLIPLISWDRTTGTKQSQCKVSEVTFPKTLVIKVDQNNGELDLTIPVYIFSDLNWSLN